jgi:pimeloyl-ACP methyl ester carboxylesterase
MRKILRVSKFVLLSVLVLVLAVAGAALGYRAYLQHRHAQAQVINAPNGIDEGFYVRIGGIDQWVQIRGQDRDNPVLLCLHGGPGATWTPLTLLFVPWEKNFTVVQWDQRGAGKTLETTGASVAETMSIERMAQDGIELSEFLRTHLHQDKIVLLGHSWGSILGMHMARRRPELFLAYVGTGQASDMKQSQQRWYAHTLDRARAANDKQALTDLEGIGPPPYRSLEAVATQFRWLGSYAAAEDQVAQTSLVGSLLFGAPNYSLWDIYYRGRGFTQIPTWQLYQEMLSTDLAALGTNYPLPIYFFQGADDEITPPDLARALFDAIHAPHKEFVLFEGGGHFVAWTQPDRMLRELVARVRPLAP